MMQVGEAAEQLSAGLGFERVEVVHGTTYRDCSTVIIAPTRGTINHRVVTSWQNLISPMNQKRAFLFAAGDEVGRAYDGLIKRILADPNLSTWKYVLTVEDDNLLPPDAHIRLIESIEEFKLDGVGGIYFTKGSINMPMAYGDPAEYARTGVLDFKPRDIRDALKAGQVMEVNGTAMGCTLYRMDLFRELDAPWFVTVADVIPEKGAQCYTQDLFFAERAKRLGKRFGVDLRVKCGHLDTTTGIVY